MKPGPINVIHVSEMCFWSDQNAVADNFISKIRHAIKFSVPIKFVREHACSQTQTHYRNVLTWLDFFCCCCCCIYYAEIHCWKSTLDRKSSAKTSKSIEIYADFACETKPRDFVCL